MRWFLSSNAGMHAIVSNMHRVESALGRLTSAQAISLSEQRTDVSRMTDIVGSCGGGSFIVDHTRHSISKSRYGRRTVTSSTYTFGRAIIFAVDSQGSLINDICNAIADGEYRQSTRASVASSFSR